MSFGILFIRNEVLVVISIFIVRNVGHVTLGMSFGILFIRNEVLVVISIFIRLRIVIRRAGWSRSGNHLIHRDRLCHHLRYWYTSSSRLHVIHRFHNIIHLYLCSLDRNFLVDILILGLRDVHIVLHWNLFLPRLHDHFLVVPCYRNLILLRLHAYPLFLSVRHDWNLLGASFIISVRNSSWNLLLDLPGDLDGIILVHVSCAR